MLRMDCKVNDVITNAQNETIKRFIDGGITGVQWFETQYRNLATHVQEYINQIDWKKMAYKSLENANTGGA